MQALLRRGVGKPIFPTTSYDRARENLSTTKARLVELQGLMLADIPADIVDDERLERQAEIHRLTEKRTKLIADVRNAIHAASEFIEAGDNNRSSLAKMERDQTDFASTVDLEANPFKRAISLAELQKVQAEALLEVDRYDNHARALNERISQMDALISDFKQFGVKPG